MAKKFIKLKYLQLKNFCGFKDTTFDFTHDDDDSIKNLAMFFGPNGTGKSSILDAIRLVAGAQIHESRDTSMLFRKLTYHPDYDPDIEGFKVSYREEQAKGNIIGGGESGQDKIIQSEWINSNMMHVAAVFDTDDGEKNVLINTNGVKINELPHLDKGAFNNYSYYIDADNPMNMNKFQFPEEYKDQFIELAETVYNLKCELIKPVYQVGANGQNFGFFLDFVINKGGDKVHFKRMSAGEKKIATLIRNLFDPAYKSLDIIMVDNLEMHIYFERHAPMIDKLLDMFPDKQLLFTTHSPILVGCKALNIEPYVHPEYLYDVEKYKAIEEETLLSK